VFKSFKSVSFTVDDIEKGKNWYNSVLESKPVFESPMIVVYQTAGIAITLLKGSNDGSIKRDSPVIFFEVDDIDAAYKELLEKGAKPVFEISIYFNQRIAKVADPFGNVIGIFSKDKTKAKTLDDRPSETAMTVAFCRAFSNAEEDEALKGDDYLAKIFLNEISLKPLKDRTSFEWVKKNVMNDGSYEFIIARTAFYDNIVKQELGGNIPQIVLLGAGYDSRAYRFKDIIKDTIIYELDAVSTQRRKIEMLEKAEIKIPANVRFVEADFTKDSIIDLLAGAGYKKDLKTLFIWEGVTYYLKRGDIDKTLEMIKNSTPVGSILCFDYVMTAPDMKNRYKAKEVMEKMKLMYSAEQVHRGFEEGGMGEYLKGKGFELVEHFNPEEMEKKYLMQKGGTTAGKVTAVFCLAKAVAVQ
jgi:methyltransferase (TIGR00027 family)